MAEYANANFFSELTCFRNFTYPNKTTSVDVEDRDISDPRGVRSSVMRQYYIKKRDGESTPSSESVMEDKQGYRLATVGFLKDYITKYFPIIYRDLDSPGLDGGVYYDYAEKLIPRAVGYSAGLLEYFFRGKLDAYVAWPVFDGSSIEKLGLKIKNVTPTGETIKDGWFTLTYHYTPSDGSAEVFGSSKSPSGELKFQNETTIEFPLTNPLENYPDLVIFTLVFQGALGNEEGAVVAQIPVPYKRIIYEH
jgi:hypothetical protein